MNQYRKLDYTIIYSLANSADKAQDSQDCEFKPHHII